MLQRIISALRNRKGASMYLWTFIVMIIVCAIAMVAVEYNHLGSVRSRVLYEAERSAVSAIEMVTRDDHRAEHESVLNTEEIEAEYSEMLKTRLSMSNGSFEDDNGTLHYGWVKYDANGRLLFAIDESSHAMRWRNIANTTAGSASSNVIDYIEGNISDDTQTYLEITFDLYIPIRYAKVFNLERMIEAPIEVVVEQYRIDDARSN